MSKPRSSAKTLIIADDEEVEPEEQLNPFSFREFLRWKKQDPDQDQDHDSDQDQVSSSLTFDPELRSCFYSDPSLGQLAPQEVEEEDEEWGRSFRTGVDSTSSICTEEEEEEEEETRFSSKPDVHQRGRDNYEGDDETSIAEPAAAGRRSQRSSQMQQLREENMSLRRTVRDLQRTAEASKCRVAELSEELVQRRHQEEKEAQDLESMVHSVEKNLGLMTKRALKAESSVVKLRAELQQLQTELESLRSENDRLKSAESEVVMTMKHNAQVASEYLSKTASHAHSSIRQLMGGAETLLLVSQLLQSIDKISDLDSQP